MIVTLFEHAVPVTRNIHAVYHGMFFFYIFCFYRTSAINYGLLVSFNSVVE